MKSTRSSRLKKSCLLIPVSLLAFIIIVAAGMALSNLNLPQHSSSIDQLSGMEKAYLSESLHLRTELGDATWPGWSQVEIPVIAYNEKYAFLVGYPNPPAGWLKIPDMQPRGGIWEEVPGDLFEGQPYYRTSIDNPEQSPQAFTDLVGDRWVASFGTREYSQIGFYQGFRQDLPPFISTFVPVRLVWALLMGKTETHIGALEHEAFHAYQGMVAESQLLGAERMYDVEATYPYAEQEESWLKEMDVLVQAIQAKTDTEAVDLARQFVQLRVSRRVGLSAEQVKFERMREWEEGLAKYAELEITRLAGADVEYVPVDGLNADKEFHHYQGQQSFWSEQLREAKNPNISRDTRFYYSGNALAILLDRLLPGWKTQAVPGGDYLDNLLQHAVR